MAPSQLHTAQTQQREYYARTASSYDSAHCSDDWGANAVALTFLIGMVRTLDVRTLLDVGSGTGRALRRFKQEMPHIRVVGVEPCAELREQGYAHGLSAEELIDGDANHLPFADGEFDMVTEFGMLHHVPDPGRVVSEMLRVARVGVFISDANNFGQGPKITRAMKQLVDAAGLWKAFNFVRTRGRGYMVSEGDGVYYSYSVFDNFEPVRRACKSTNLLSTANSGANLYRGAATVALLGLK